MKFALGDNAILHVFHKKNIIIFGAGEDGELFIDLFHNKLNIIKILDNKVGENKKSIRGIQIYKPNKIIKLAPTEVIIITSRRYATEIAFQLALFGLRRGVDYFSWNPDNILFPKDYVEKIKCFTMHNCKVFKDFFPTTQKNNKVLVKFFQFQGTFFVFYSYIVNLLAQRYDAEIISFKERTGRENKLSEELYSSFNAGRFIEKWISLAQKKYAYKMMRTIFQSLRTEKDWLDITIDGENYGIYIVSDYIRFTDPIFDLSNVEQLKKHLFRFLCDIKFWQDFFSKHHNIKAVVVGDAIYRDGVLVRIALQHGVEVYSLNSLIGYKYNCERLNNPYGFEFRYYKKFFDELTDDEKIAGIKWAQKRLHNRLEGSLEDISYMAYSSFSKKRYPYLLEKNEKTKVMICVHSFTDYPYPVGRYAFSTLYEWLCFLGDISEKTNYDWYLKPHPNAPWHDSLILDKFVSRYNNIKVLPMDASPHQLKAEGMKFALTLWGTIGHEYPALGIQVINGSAINPHCAFDFNWHAKTRAEYEYLLMNLDTLHKNIDINEIYQFYCVHYLYNKKLKMRWSIFFQSPELHHYEISEGSVDGYKLFLEEWSEKRGREIIEGAKKYLKEIDNYKIGVFCKDDNVNFHCCRN